MPKKVVTYALRLSQKSSMRVDAKTSKSIFFKGQTLGHKNSKGQHSKNLGLENLKKIK
jgi:hypothetical protein